MGEYCQVFLDKNSYAPGETITGRVHCHFLSENEVRNINLRFKGKAKVLWKVGKQNHFEEEYYFDMESPLLQDKTTFPPGDYDYPFTFNLKSGIPSSAYGKHGEIKYSVTANVDRPLALDYKSEKVFVVYTPNVLYLREYDEPLELACNHIPTWSLFSKDPMRLIVKIPKRNYTVLEMVSFTALVQNFSNINVKEVRFNLVQGYLYYASNADTSSTDWEGQEYAIIDSCVPPNSEKTWNLELRIPKQMYDGYGMICKIMRPFWELRGELVLPFPNSNFKIKIPIHVGGASD